MKTDFVVVGSGVAGLTSALTLADCGKKVLLVSKESLVSGSSRLAQGGIAAVVGENDSFRSHIEDTIAAGAEYNDISEVRFLVEHGPSAINWLETKGVHFDSNSSGYLLGREAAHREKRILHITDFTGLAIVQKLVERVRENPNITCLENCFLLDLLVENNRCYGVQLLAGNRVFNYFAAGTILASGGLGQIYQWTTNPLSATGDGIAAAFRAGARIKDLEFIQFHPTAFEHDSPVLFLLSEAIRGEGAYLVNERGERFVQKHDSRGELAPRDIVARAIYLEHKNGRVFLDIRHKGKVFLQKRFPNIYAYLMKLGFDMAADLLPVTPAEHYLCGGVVIDIYGRTNIANLFAYGEVSCSGVHGANRLASNSLLEAVVFPRQLTKIVHDLPKTIEEKEFGIPGYKSISGFAGGIKYPDIKRNLQKIMWEKVGIVRTREGMESALEQLTKWDGLLQKEVRINRDFVELKNMVTAAKLVTESALARKKSLGAHYVCEKVRI